MKKRGLALILVMAMAITTILSACGKTPEKSGSEGSSTSQTTNQGASSNEASGKPVKVSMYIQDSAEAALTNDMPIVQAIQDATNVEFDFILGPNATDQFTEKFNTLIASNQIPDIMCNTVDGNIMYKAAADGVFLPLEDLIDQYMPNLKKILQENPYIENFIRGNDGHIYFFPYVGSIKAFLVWMIREDWLKNVGMDVPVTTDDWYNVLKAFKEQDANGNGDPNDEIPFISRQGLNGATAFMEAWGVSQTGGELFLEKDGETVSYPYLSDRAKEGLEFINKLYTEGLLDPEYASDGTDAWVEKTSNDIAGATWDTTARAFSASSMVQITTGKDDARYIVVPAPIGPYGDQMTCHQMQAVRGYTGVSAKTEHAVEIAKLFDFMYSEEGFMLNNWGVKGITYDIGADGEPYYLDEIAHDSQGRGILQMLNLYGHREWSYKQDIRYENALLDPEYSAMRDATEAFIQQSIPPLSYTEDEQERFNELSAEIQTYKDEKINSFIMGKTPFSDWSKFTDTLKQMGVEELVKIEQDAYNRFIGK